MALHVAVLTLLLTGQAPQQSTVDDLVAQGRAELAAQRYDAAIDAFQRAIDIARQLHAGHVAQPFGGRARLEDELQSLREELARIRDFTEVASFRTVQDSSRLQARIRELERERDASLAPFEPPTDILLILGVAQFRAAQYEAAETTWRQAVRINSGLGEAWNNLAVLYHALGRKAEAHAAVDRAERAGARIDQRLKDDIKAMK